MSSSTSYAAVADGPEASALAAETRLSLEKDGQGIGMADYLIAGVCLANGGVLLTRNLDHFERVPGLKISGRMLKDAG